MLPFPSRIQDREYAEKNEKRAYSSSIEAAWRQWIDTSEPILRSDRFHSSKKGEHNLLELGHLVLRVPLVNRPTRVVEGTLKCKEVV